MLRRSLLALPVLFVPQLAEGAPKLVTVIGDSHAHGMAFGLHRADEHLWVQDSSKGGTASWQMPVAPDDGSDVIVSAGTVDCGAREPDDQMAWGILRVLGPFAEGKQKHGGRLLFVIPHDRLRGQYAYVNPRITRLRVMIQMALDVRRIPYVIMDTDPGPDGVHLDLDGYTALARQALQSFP